MSHQWKASPASNYSPVESTDRSLRDDKENKVFLLSVDILLDWLSPLRPTARLHFSAVVLRARLMRYIPSSRKSSVREQTFHFLVVVVVVVVWKSQSDATWQNLLESFGESIVRSTRRVQLDESIWWTPCGALFNSEATSVQNNRFDLVSQWLQPKRHKINTKKNQSLEHRVPSLSND